MLRERQERAELEASLRHQTELIARLREENEGRGRLILGLKDGNQEGQLIQDEGQAPPPEDPAKIRLLFKRILCAAEDPAVIDWVTTIESRMNCLEREASNLRQALEASRQTCQVYHSTFFSQ